MKLTPHRITYRTKGGGHIRTNILIEASDIEEAKEEFRKDFKEFEVVEG